MAVQPIEIKLAGYCLFSRRGHIILYEVHNNRFHGNGVPFVTDVWTPANGWNATLRRSASSPLVSSRLELQNQDAIPKYTRAILSIHNELEFAQTALRLLSNEALAANAIVSMQGLLAIHETYFTGHPERERILDLATAPMRQLLSAMQACIASKQPAYANPLMLLQGE